MQKLFANHFFRISFFIISFIGLLLISRASGFFELLPFYLRYAQLDIFTLLLALSLASSFFRAGHFGSTFGININKYSLSEFKLPFLLSLISVVFFLIYSFVKLDYLAINPNLSLLDVLVFSFAILILATNEELFFRGILFQALIERFNIFVVTVILSLFFSIAHYYNTGFNLLAAINVFLAGILFSTMYYRTRSLIPSIILHFCWNLFSGILFGNISGNRVKSEVILFEQPSVSNISYMSSFGIESTFYVSFLMIAYIILTLKYSKENPFILSKIFKQRYLESKIKSRSLQP